MRPRPCHCDRHVPGQPFVRGRDCRRCWLFHNDPVYAKHWGVKPSIWRRLLTFTRALLQHVRGGLRKVSTEEKARRLAICTTGPCSEYDNGTCKKCGCNLSIKASWKSEQCPLNKWNEAPTTQGAPRPCCNRK